MNTHNLKPQMHVIRSHPSLLWIYRFLSVSTSKDGYGRQNDRQECHIADISSSPRVFSLVTDRCTSCSLLSSTVHMSCSRARELCEGNTAWNHSYNTEQWEPFLQKITPINTDELLVVLSRQLTSFGMKLPRVTSSVHTSHKVFIPPGH